MTLAPSGSGKCASTCYGSTCDYWVSVGYSCDTMTNSYKCDCTGCSCGKAPTSAPVKTPAPTGSGKCLATCFGQTCDYYSYGYTCADMTNTYGCDCSGCICGGLPTTYPTPAPSGKPSGPTAKPSTIAPSKPTYEPTFASQMCPIVGSFNGNYMTCDQAIAYSLTPDGSWLGHLTCASMTAQGYNCAGCTCPTATPTLAPTKTSCKSTCKNAGGVSILVNSFLFILSLSFMYH